MTKDGLSIPRDRTDRPTPPPIIEFHHYSGHAREWCCIIKMPNGDYHGGEGTTQCEALLLASVNWGMHGK